MRIVGYVYEAAYHCPCCAEKKFGEDLEDAVDFEGNEVSPIYDIELQEAQFCDTCFDQIN